MGREAEAWEGSEQMGHIPQLGIQRCPMATLEKTVCGQPEGAIALLCIDPGLIPSVLLEGLMRCCLWWPVVLVGDHD